MLLSSVKTAKKSNSLLNYIELALHCVMANNNFNQDPDLWISTSKLTLLITD